MLWSVLNPLLTLFVMRLVFLRFFGRSTPHYTVFLFAGTIFMSYFKDSTQTGMESLVYNATVLQKINIPKYLFIFSRNVSAFVNFLLTFLVFLFFCVLDRLPVTWNYLLLIFPILCATALNIGVGMILSCWYVFFRDITYLYGIFLTLLTYLSGIFYNVNEWGEYSKLFLLNPVYVLIAYVRQVCIDGTIPSLAMHALMFFYPALFLLIGALTYRKYRHEFIYYL